MTIWEKAVVNMQRGAQKLTATAATISERVKVEINYARLRIKLGEVQTAIDEQHRTIGRRVVDMERRSVLPKSTELLMKDDEVVTAVTELAAQEKRKEDILAELAEMREAAKPAVSSQEGRAR